MNGRLVSVVVAARNGERFVAQALDSILAQGWRPIEILVVDGHSTDRTVEIARSYPLVRVVSQHNRGIGDAYNLGIAVAQGDFIAFLSHDDLWTADKLNSQMCRLLEHPEYEYVVGRVKFFLETGCVPPPGFRQELLEGDRVAYIMETLLARKTLFQKVGGFNPHFSSGEDVDWFSRAKDEKVPHAVVDRVLVHKRVHNTNLSLNDSATNEILLRVLRQSIARKRSGREDA